MPKSVTPDVVVDRDLGAHVVDDGTVFTVWAPRHKSVTIVLEGGATHDMETMPDGYFRLRVRNVGAGQKYWYQVADARRPDPVSRYQPDGVFGPSMVIDHSAFEWSDVGWGAA